MAEATNSIFIPKILIGETVNNRRIIEEFLCSPQGGMRRSTKTNTLVLVSKHVASMSKVYDDKVVNGVYHYTGQGMKGDQSLAFAQNKTLAESQTNHVDIHFFEVFKEGQYIYVGRVELVSKPYQDTQDDEDGRPRKVWVFPLKLIDGDNPQAYLDKELVTEVYKDQVKIAEKLEMNELEKRAVKSGSAASSRKTYTKTYVRNPYIAEFTKRQANGFCQLCEVAAPFNDRNDDPYLESHHIVWLSNNGPDTIENTVALCPNCHKRMHVRNDEADITKLKSLKQKFA